MHKAQVFLFKYAAHTMYAHYFKSEQVMCDFSLLSSKSLFDLTAYTSSGGIRDFHSDQFAKWPTTLALWEAAEWYIVCVKVKGVKWNTSQQQ